MMELHEIRLHHDFGRVPQAEVTSSTTTKK